MTRSRKRLSRSLLADSLSGLAVALVATSSVSFTSSTLAQSQLALAEAGVAAQGSNASQGAQELYLEVVLNRVPTGKLARFEVRDQQLWSDATTLRDIGLRLPSDVAAGKQALLLARIPGLTVNFDAKAQRVMLDVPVALLAAPNAQIEVPPTRAATANPADQLRGLLINYDLYGQRQFAAGSSGDATSLSAWSEMRLMGVGSGNLSNTMISRARDGDNNSGDVQRTDRGTVRLDTSWQRNFQDSMTTLTLGDTVTGGLSWTRPTRIGGIRLSRNFALQPYRITTPLAQLHGDAALPSTVDLYLNGMRQSTQQVLPGQFTLGSIPTLNGRGDAQMVITDINGQQRTVNLALYGSTQLLQQGLGDWSIEMGSVRRDYGLRSFAYRDNAMASASGRYGLSNRVTIEAHAEGDPDVQMLGVGGAWLISQRLGMLNGSLAASHHNGQLQASGTNNASSVSPQDGPSRSGQQATLGWQWNSPVWNASFSSMRRNAGFRDVASMDGYAPARASDQAFIGATTRWGNWGAGYIAQSQADGTRSRWANLSWSRQVSRNINLNLNAMRDLEGRNGTSLYVSMSIALERAITLTASARRDHGNSSAVIGANQSASSDLGGWGWRAEASAGDSRYAQAQLNHLGNFGQWTLGMLRQPGSSGGTSAYASANGALLYAQNQLYPMRSAPDSFALISTDGISDVPVRLENRLVGATNDQGFLLVDRLNAYQRNQLSIDTLNLAPNLQIQRVQLDAVPEAQSGVLARFAMRPVVTLQLQLKDAAGAYLPAGSDAQLATASAPEQRRLVIGFDGMASIENPPADALLTARTASGEPCVAHIPAQRAQAIGFIDLGTLICQSTP